MNTSPSSESMFKGIRASGAGVARKNIVWASYRLGLGLEGQKIYFCFLFTIGRSVDLV